MQAKCIAVIILGAGQSTRFGSSKMDHVLPNNKTVLNSTIDQYQSVFNNVTVVIPTLPALEQTYADADVKTLTIDSARQGMSQSLITGVASQPNAVAWLIALGDMPYVETQTIQQLALQASSKNIIVPTVNKRRGNPVIFGCDFKADLMALKGDVGAKGVLDANPHRVIEVPVSDIGVLHDIDRLDDILLR